MKQFQTQAMIANPDTLKVLVADDEPEMREYFSHLVTQIGHHVVATAGTGTELIERCRATTPDLIITDVRMPDVDGLEAVSCCFAERPVAVIVISALHEPELIDRAATSHLLAFLVKPIKAVDLECAIPIAMQQFHESRALQQRAKSLQHTLEHRRILERIDSIVMQQNGSCGATSSREMQYATGREDTETAGVSRCFVLSET